MRAAMTFVALLLSGLFAACGDDDAGGGVPACKPTLRPVVMVHGFLASGDTWASFARRFEANGYCADHLYALDWNTLSREGAVEALDALIDEALAATGDDQVDLIGHSAGGGVSYSYLSDPARAAKVAAYAHLASNPAPIQGVDAAPAGPADAPIPTLNLTSSGDTVVEGGSIPGAINLVLSSEDHYQVATSDKAFEDVFGFLHGGKRPATTDAAGWHPFAEDLPRVVAGKALTIGENTPVAGWTVAVYAVDAATGRRVDEVAEATFTVASDGSWGPFEAQPGVAYEFHLSGPGPGDRPVHYYREPFAASNRFVRLRALPSPGTLVAALFSVIPFEPEHAVLIAFTESQAVVNGRDTLTVGDETMSTPALASAERTSIAFFLFDEGADQKAGEEVATFKNVTPVFLTAIDRFLPAGEASITLMFNGRSLAVPAWPSDPDGAIVATFD